MADADHSDKHKHSHGRCCYFFKKKLPLIEKNCESEKNWSAVLKVPGCLWFLSWMKELPHSFPEGSEVSLCTACLPARPPRLPHAEWVLLTPSLPAAAARKHVKGVCEILFVARADLNLKQDQRKPGSRTAVPPNDHSPHGKTDTAVFHLYMY